MRSSARLIARSRVSRLPSAAGRFSSPSPSPASPPGAAGEPLSPGSNFGNWVSHSPATPGCGRAMDLRSVTSLSRSSSRDFFSSARIIGCIGVHYITGSMSVKETVDGGLCGFFARGEDKDIADRKDEISDAEVLVLRELHIAPVNVAPRAVFKDGEDGSCALVKEKRSCLCKKRRLPPEHMRKRAFGLICAYGKAYAITRSTRIYKYHETAACLVYELLRRRYTPHLKKISKCRESLRGAVLYFYNDALHRAFRSEEHTSELQSHV